jgi:D-alanine-D-alanine ligase
MAKKISVLVFMGGPSSEHEVSLSSGTGVVRALDSQKYLVHPVLVQKDGHWIWSSRPLTEYQKQNFAVNYFATVEGTAMQKKLRPSLAELPPAQIAFLALHGVWGEDGHVQALLEHWGIPYTGSGMAASALAMDKIQSKMVYLANGLPTPKFQVFRKGDALDSSLGFPLVIKDPVGGSSLNQGIAHNAEEAQKICADLLDKTERLLIEQFIEGGEASCGYIEGEAKLPPTEVRMTTRPFFDFEAKYKGEVQEITPAEFAPELTVQIQEIAKKCHEVLGCRVYSRTDVRIDKEGRLWILETNTLPGLTPTSFLPQQAAAIGLSYAQLLDVILLNSSYAKNS